MSEHYKHMSKHLATMYLQQAFDRLSPEAKKAFFKKLARADGHKEGLSLEHYLSALLQPSASTDRLNSVSSFVKIYVPYLNGFVPFPIAPLKDIRSEPDKCLQEAIRRLQEALEDQILEIDPDLPK